MKKRVLGLLLALCLALPLFAASAEEMYVPGEITRSLVKSAFDAGKMLTGELALSLDMDTAFLFGDDEESAAQFDSILSVLRDARLSLGVGKLEEGLRLELGASYVPEDAKGASVSAAADVTLDGVSVESDLIEGQKITAKWETLLALAGVDRQTSAMILSLRDMDWEAELAAAMAQFQAVAQQSAQVVLPYAQTVGDFIAALPAANDTDVPADATHPAAATRFTITFTRDDVRRLIVSLADQLEQDETLVPLLDSLLAQSASADADAPANTAALCAAIREEVADLTGQEPYTFVVGFDAEDTPLYAEITGQLGSGLYIACYPGDGAQQFSFTAVEIEEDGTVDFSIALSGSFATDNPDMRLAQNVDFAMQMQGVEDGVPVASMDYALTCRPLTTQDGQPGYTVTGSMDMNVTEDGETLREVMSVNTEQVKTATGGESSKVSTHVDAYDDEVQVAITANGSMTMEPDGDDGFTGRYVISEEIPAMGLRDFTFDIALASREYDAAALTPLALESATSEDIEALSQMAMAAFQGKFIDLLSALPQDVQQMILNAE